MLDKRRDGCGEEAPGLNAAQRRAVSVRLRAVDEALGRFERLASRQKVASVLYQEDDNLTLEQRQGILSRITAIKEILVELRDGLHLETKTVDAAALIRAQCAVLWADIAELESGHLRSYGPVPPGMAPFLDPRIEKLQRQLKELAFLVS